MNARKLNKTEAFLGRERDQRRNMNGFRKNAIQERKTDLEFPRATGRYLKGLKKNLKET